MERALLVGIATAPDWLVPAYPAPRGKGAARGSIPGARRNHLGHCRATTLRNERVPTSPLHATGTEGDKFLNTGDPRGSWWGALTVIIAMIFGMILAQEPAKAVVDPRPAVHMDAPGEPEHKADQPKPADDTARSVSDQALHPDSDRGYRIGSEDVLQIDVWKETDFSTSVPVRPDGKISIPLLNDVQAAGLTPVELADSLREKLRQYVIDPKITVIVSQTNSRKAYVMGTVNHQGTVRLLSNLTVLQAISASGGLAPFARSKQIYVLRNEAGEQRRLAFNYDAVIKGKHPEQNIVLQPGDTVVVP